MSQWTIFIRFFAWTKNCAPDVDWLWVICLLGTTLLGACAGGISISTGGSGTLNDARPSGIILFQGNLEAAGGQTTTTGVASIYLSGSTYIARLEGLSVTSESNLLFKVNYTYGNIPYTSQFYLRGTSGNQNYTLSNIQLNSIFTTVEIYSTIHRISYGISPLSRVSF